ncbi:MAG: CDP-diacylglycerol--glycerol-3-phosphate 3-phosphatidyltransferase [Pseudomonadota bacterium]
MTWTIPNILTVIRLLAAPGIVIAFVLLSRPLADWVAPVLFIGASLTDYLDGYLARALDQKSKFGAMLDPIADKAMVIIALAVVLGNSGMNPWLALPAAFILLREVFVSGLREFLGADAGRLAVTKLAKWKTTAQMVALAILLGAMGAEAAHLAAYMRTDLDLYEKLMAERAPLWWYAQIGFHGGVVGAVLLWAAALLTLVTGWDYLRKAMPFLKEDPAP